MQIYTNTEAESHYPVGFAAIVVAPSREVAASLLRAKMVEHGLKPDSVKAEDFTEVTTASAYAIILVDGNY